MYLKDHMPPHFHAVFAEYEAMFSIETGEIIQGDLPKSQMRIVQAWTELHRDELKKNFELLTADNATFFKIEPLH